MDTAKVFTSGGSQAVRIPEKYRFDEKEVYIKKVGNAIYLFSKKDPMGSFLNSFGKMGDDFMKDGRDQGLPQVRPSLDLL